MAAARYWRAVGLQPYGVGDLELSAFHLYHNGARVDAGATLTSRIDPTAGTVSNLQDSDTLTSCRWADVSAPGFALVWDLATAQEVTAIRLGSGASSAEFLERVTVQRSADGIDWVTSGIAEGLAFPGASSMQDVPPSGDALYYETTLLLHGRGVVGGTTLIDSSPNPKTPHLNDSGVRVSGAASKFGGMSIGFPPTGFGRGVSYQSAGILPTGTADFCIDVWACANGYPSAGVKLLFSMLNTFNFELRGDGQLGLYIFSGGAYAAGGSFAIGVFNHVAMVRRSGTFYVYLNGSQIISIPSSASLSSTYFYIGGEEANISWMWNGYFDDIRVTSGFPRYTGNFTPPTLEAPDSELGAVVGAQFIRPSGVAPVVVVGEDVVGSTTPIASFPPSPFDIYDAGRGRIIGTVKEKNTPTNTPLKRRVVLLSMPGSRAIRETWSDPATGAYEFTEVAMDRVYTVVSYDHTGIYRGVVADNLTPEAMP